MPSKEEDFKRRFALILEEMQAGEDPTMTALVGSLADRIVGHANELSWSAFKATLSQPAYRSLLTTFQSQGNALAKQGAQRQMRAMEILACSLIAKTQIQDPEVIAGDGRLDDMIDEAIRTCRTAQAADPIIS